MWDKVHKTSFLFFLVLLSFSSLGGAYIKKELNIDDDQNRPPEAPRVTSFTPAQVVIPDQNFYLREINSLREEVSKLRKDISDQKDLTSMLLDRTSDLSNSQNQINSQLQNTVTTLKDISSDTEFLKQQLLFRDTFIFNKDGKPFAFIDPNLRIYEYAGGNLIGLINPDTNEIIRNYDGSTVATLEKNFLIDQNGQPIGSVERSETLRLEREKLYPQIQKTPLSHFFVPIEGKKQFIQIPDRFSDWSTQKLDDILFFSEKKIQELK